MRISARADYALRAGLELAAAWSSERLVTADEIARRQGIPRAFLDGILCDFRDAGLVTSRRGPNGGYRLARPANEITAGDVLRAVDGPLTLVRGCAPDGLEYPGVAEPLRGVWLLICSGVAELLDGLMLADLIAEGRRPRPLRQAAG
jgi:Rrf2 family protein